MITSRDIQGELMTVAKVAGLFGYSKQTVRNWMRRGLFGARLPSARLDAMLVTTANDLEAFLQASLRSPEMTPEIRAKVTSVLREGVRDAD